MNMILFLALSAGAAEPLKSTYIFEVPKYSLEFSFSRGLRKSVRAKMMKMKCDSVVIGNPLALENLPPWAHPSDNYKRMQIASSNCKLIQKPTECEGTWKSHWLFEDQKGAHDWIVCRRG